MSSSSIFEIHKQFLDDVILPHLALILTPILSSFNTVLSRAAFTMYDSSKGEEALHPITYLVTRTSISVFVFVFIKYMGWFGSGHDRDDNCGDDDVDDDKEKHHNAEEPKRACDENVGHGPSEQPSLEQQQEQQHREGTSSPPSVSRNKFVIIKISGPKACDPLKEGATFVHVVSTIGVGILGTTINYLCFFYGVLLTSGLTVGSFMAMVPGTVFIVSYLLGFEPFSWMKFFMTAVVFLGNVFLSQLWLLFQTSASPSTSSSPSSPSSSSSNLFSEGGGGGSSSETSTNSNSSSSSYYIGVICMMFATICFSLYLVLQKPLVGKFHYVDFMIIIQTSGLMSMLLITLFPRENLVTSQIFGNKLAPLAWYGIVFGGIAQGALNWFLMSYGVAKCKSVTFVALVMNSAPLFVILESMLLLGETANQWEEIGVIIIIAGIGMAIYSSVSDKLKSGGDSDEASTSTLTQQVSDDADHNDKKAEVKTNSSS